MISILGLGPNEVYAIKDDIKEILLNAKDKSIIARTKEHPAIKFLDDNQISYETCDRFYEASDDFLQTYTSIADYILEKAKEIDVLYLVPGHPMVAEFTTKLILEKSNDAKVIGGQSFLDVCFNLAKFDPVEGFSLLDATNRQSFNNINTNHHILITQCYDDITAADVSVELDRYYPYHHRVLVMEAVGCEDEKIYETSLSELSSAVSENINNLRTLYIAPLKDGLDINIKNYIKTDEFYKTSDLISHINNALKTIKANSEDDKLVTKELAKIIQNALNFTYSEDNYIEINDILEEMK